MKIISGAIFCLTSTDISVRIIVMKIITQKKIGNNINHSQGFISEVASRKKFTTKVEIARAVAEAYGGAPIDYIHPDRRELYLKAYPGLKKAICKTGGK